VSYSLPASVQAQTSAQPRTSEAPSGAPQKTLVTPTVTYEYDGAYNRVTGRVVRMAYPNGQRTEMDYADNAGDRRMLTLRNVDPGNGTLSKFDYEYEKEGNIVAWSRQLGNAAAKTETYGYDAADQLIEATLTAGDATERQVKYEYDLAGNRTNEQAAIGQLPQTTDYEALEFDAVNRVTAVVKGTRRSEFFYDGLGRRVRMVEREGATPVSDKRYIWDGGEIVEERDGQNSSVVTKRHFGAGVQEVAANAPTNLFYSRDHLGSVREVTDANGNLGIVHKHHGI
jgi:YD repeat-containing protein